MIVFASPPPPGHTKMLSISATSVLYCSTSAWACHPLPTGKEARTSFSLGNGTKAAKTAAVQIHLARGLQSGYIMLHIHQSNPMLRRIQRCKRVQRCRFATHPVRRHLTLTTRNGLEQLRHCARQSPTFGTHFLCGN